MQDSNGRFRIEIVSLRPALQGNFARRVAQTSVAAPLVVGAVVGAPDQATVGEQMPILSIAGAVPIGRIDRRQ
jgi:hypothetical protein